MTPDETRSSEGGPADDRGLRWRLWRQDDHGNQVAIRDFDDREEAEAARAAFEARGHHQHYWVSAVPSG